MEDWRLIRTWDGEPGFQMALDEALLGSHDPRPTLRLYTWRPAALSLGYFQRWADVPQARAAPAVVRRLTGGGAIHHAGELTFSIAAPLTHALYRGEVRASYERVHALVASALATFGVSATLRGAAPARSDDPSSAMCFHRSTAIDLVWDGAKGVGSAQRRHGGRVLHHGSIKLATTPLEGPIATVAHRAPHAGRDAVADALVAAFHEGARARFAVEEPEASERSRANERAAFFTSKAFLRRR